MAGQEDQDASPGSNTVLSWYDQTRPMFIDLVGDYAGKELFLVEGDSLLRVCFEDERIDFEGEPCTRHPSLHSSLVLSLVRMIYSSSCKGHMWLIPIQTSLSSIVCMAAQSRNLNAS